MRSKKNDARTNIRAAVVYTQHKLRAWLWAMIHDAEIRLWAVAALFYVAVIIWLGVRY